MAGTTADAVQRVRAVAALVAFLLTTAGLLVLAAPLLTGPIGPTTVLADLLTRACGVLLLVGWARLALGTSACLVAHLLRRPAVARLPVGHPDAAVPTTSWVRPATAQRLAALLVGTGLGGLAAPAVALPIATPDSPAGSAPSAAPVAALPLPGRPVGGRIPATRPVPARPAGSPVLVVCPGDSLWSLAATHLLPPGGDAAVDAAWRRLYAANRAVIGPDPHLIRPGTRLDLPEPTEGLA